MVDGRPRTEARTHLAALERLERMIAAFASMVSHQTRSALVGIQGLSELIRDGDLKPDEVRACASDIFAEALKIDAMIGDMFDLDRLETGQSPFRKTRVDFNRIVRETAGHVMDTTPNLAFAIDANADSAMVLGDGDRLREAVRKVLAFVVRTAQPGSAIAVATICRDGAVGVIVRSTSSRVVDFEDWLYGRYERYEQRPSAILGAGLGLAVARAIVELHGGDIEATSGPNVGAELRLTLPVPARVLAPKARGGPAQAPERARTQ
jgi:signal transduction histidine kinase